MDAIIASGATDREVEIKIEPPEDGVRVKTETINNTANTDQGMNLDVEPPKTVKEEDEAGMDASNLQSVERAASPIAP